MNNYRLEARGLSLKGKVICGSEAGYESVRKFEFEEAEVFLREVNNNLSLEKFE